MASTLTRFAGLLLALWAAVPAPAPAREPPTFSEEDLDRLLAPVALYPDALLSQVLMASTYPLEVVEAARWAERHPGLQGETLDRALEDEPWDPSVKALVAYPTVLDRMSEDLEWTRQLGDAVLAEEPEVTAAVQRLRRRAYDAGGLASTDEQRIVVERDVIVIQPAQPEVVYVPVYDPLVVYGNWWWDEPPYGYLYRPRYALGAVVRPGFAFTLGVGVTSGWWGWSGFDWYDRHIHIDREVYVTRHVTHHGDVHRHRDRVKWEHDPHHRRGVHYRDPAVRERFAGRPRGAEADRPYRGQDRRQWSDRPAEGARSGAPGAGGERLPRDRDQWGPSRRSPEGGRATRGEPSAEQGRPPRGEGRRAQGERPADSEGRPPRRSDPATDRARLGQERRAEPRPSGEAGPSAGGAPRAEGPPAGEGVRQRGSGLDPGEWARARKRPPADARTAAPEERRDWRQRQVPRASGPGAAEPPPDRGRSERPEGRQGARPDTPGVTQPGTPGRAGPPVRQGEARRFQDPQRAAPPAVQGVGRAAAGGLPPAPAEGGRGREMRQIRDRSLPADAGAANQPADPQGGRGSGGRSRDHQERPR